MAFTLTWRHSIRTWAVLEVLGNVTRSNLVNLRPWCLWKSNSGAYSNMRMTCNHRRICTMRLMSERGDPRGHQTAWTQKSKESNFPAASLLFSLSGNKAFKCFLFSDPLCYLSGLHQISWHTISGWEAGPGGMLNSAPFSCLIDGCKHTTALIAPLQLGPLL